MFPADPQCIVPTIRLLVGVSDYFGRFPPISVTFVDMFEMSDLQ